MADYKKGKLSEFNKIFNEQIQPLLIEHEEYRRKKLKKFILPICLAVFLVTLFVISISILCSVNEDIIIVVAVITFLVCTFSIFKIMRIVAKMTIEHKVFIKSMRF